MLRGWGPRLAFEGQLHEQLEQVSEADCVEAGRPTLELRKQQERTPPEADCVKVERPTFELPEQQEPTPEVCCY